jgi:serpin B
MKTTLQVLLCSSLGFLAHGPSQAADPILLAEANNRFAQDLYSILSQPPKRPSDLPPGAIIIQKTARNLFFSPHSICSVLSMTYAGARGITAQEMENTMHWTSGQRDTHRSFAALQSRLQEVQKAGQVTLHSAHSLWPQKDYPLLPTYLELLRQQYGVAVTPVDYVKATAKARQVINHWIERQTAGKIKDLMQKGSLDPSTVLVLVNAVYFKGKWDQQFYPRATKAANFTLLNGSKKSVSMMCRYADFLYKEEENMQLLELPYKGGRVSMMVMLPRDRRGLPGLETTFTRADLQKFLSGMTEKKIQVYLPKFKITWGPVLLNEPLQSLGIRQAFGSRANFSGMDGSGELFISSVLHKALVEVTEEGTEAVAVTGSDVRRAKAEVPTIFRADHPFMFLIRERSTGCILFIGRITDPD